MINEIRRFDGKPKNILLSSFLKEKFHFLYNSLSCCCVTYHIFIKYHLYCYHYRLDCNPKIWLNWSKCFYIWTYQWNFIHWLINTVKIGKRKASRSFAWASDFPRSFTRLYEISFPSFFSIHKTYNLHYLSQSCLFFHYVMLNSLGDATVPNSSLSQELQMNYTLRRLMRSGTRQGRGLLLATLPSPSFPIREHQN